MLKNKKGVIEIFILVMIVFILVSANLLVFVTSQDRVKVDLSNPFILKKFYLKEEIAKEFFSELGGDVLEKSFVELGVDYSKVELKNSFRNKFKKDFGNYDFEDYDLISLKKLILEDKFVIEIENEILVLKVDSWEMRENFGDFQVIYNPEMYVNFDLRNF